jgi:hypothetical protein
MSSDTEDMYVIWRIRGRQKKKVTRRKYWVHSSFNKSDETGSFIVVRVPERKNKVLDHCTGCHQKFQIQSFLE